jgi:ssDNA-binding Zn-finger/Zn-ribbon topoisomerase 1
MEIKCEKCKTSMKKMQTIHAGNSKYDYYVCPKCNHEKKMCVGSSPAAARFS